MGVFWDRDSHGWGNRTQRNSSSCLKGLKRRSVIIVLRLLLQRDCVLKSIILQLFYISIADGFPVILDRHSNKPGTFITVSFCTVLKNTTQHCSVWSSLLSFPFPLLRIQLCARKTAEGNLLLLLTSVWSVKQLGAQHLLHKLGLSAQAKMKCKQNAAHCCTLCLSMKLKPGWRRDICFCFPWESTSC